MSHQLKPSRSTAITALALLFVLCYESYTATQTCEPEGSGRAPEITLTETNFEKQQAEINESALQAAGEMSVDDIENWNPAH